MCWRIFAHPNAISKNVHSIDVARLRVFTQPRPSPDIGMSEVPLSASPEVLPSTLWIVSVRGATITLGRDMLVIVGRRMMSG